MFPMSFERNQANYTGQIPRVSAESSNARTNGVVGSIQSRGHSQQQQQRQIKTVPILSGKQSGQDPVRANSINPSHYGPGSRPNQTQTYLPQTDSLNKRYGRNVSFERSSSSNMQMQNFQTARSSFDQSLSRSVSIGAQRSLQHANSSIKKYTYNGMQQVPFSTHKLSIRLSDARDVQVRDRQQRDFGSGQLHENDKINNQSSIHRRQNVSQKNKADQVASPVASASPSGERRPCGLSNLGNTCYMNSVIQLLGCIDQLLLYIEKYNKELSSSPIGYQLGSLGNGLLCGYRCDPGPFVKAFKQNHKIFNNYEQQDASEFMSKVLEHISNTLNKSTFQEASIKSTGNILEDSRLYRAAYREKRNSFIEKLFDMATVWISTCQNCGGVSSSFGMYTCLPLTIPQKATSLRDCLVGQTQSEHVSGYKCDKCKQEVDIQRQFRVCAPPRFLLITLCRFSYDYRGRQRKINQAISIPSSLDLTQFSINPEEVKNKYELRGMVNHSGSTLEFGHYTAQVSMRSCWYNCDDGTISPIAPPNGASSKAYILLYKRIDV